MHDDRFARDDLAAWACIRLDRLAHGYRMLHLFDRKGVQTKGVIFVRIDYQWNIDESDPQPMSRSSTLPLPQVRKEAVTAKHMIAGMIGKAKEKAKDEIEKHTSGSDHPIDNKTQSKLTFRQQTKP
jgi:hypothetical protein